MLTFASWSLLRPTLDQFGFQEGSKIDQKKWSKKLIEFGIDFLNDFWSILAPNLGGPGGATNQVFGVKLAPGANLGPEAPSKLDFWSILIDFWSILGWFWVDFASILGSMLTDFYI